MPIYEYRCRSCGDTFEALRSVDDADLPILCAAGHGDAVRLLSLVARPADGGSASASAPAPAGGGGGCCGGGCCS